MALSTGCGGSKHAAATTLPDCVHPGSSVARPSGLKTFPLPAGSVLDAQRAAAPYSIVTGYIPGDVGHVRDFFHNRLPRAGYRLGKGDAEDAEAETEFAGHGVRGRLKVHRIEGCAGALTLQIAVRTDQSLPSRKGP